MKFKECGYCGNETSFPNGYCEHCGKKKNGQLDRYKSTTNYQTNSGKLTEEYPNVTVKTTQEYAQPNRRGSVNVNNVDWSTFSKKMESGQLSQQEIKTMNGLLTVLMLVFLFAFPPIGIVIAIVRGQIMKKIKSNQPLR